MPSTYTQHHIESAVAISGDLHGHARFEEFVERHDRLRPASDRWNFCIDAALEFERVSHRLGVRWGDTHDYYLAIESLIDELVSQGELDTRVAIQAALSRSKCVAS